MTLTRHETPAQTAAAAKELTLALASCRTYQTFSGWAGKLLLYFVHYNPTDPRAFHQYEWETGLTPEPNDRFYADLHIEATYYFGPETKDQVTQHAELSYIHSGSINSFHTDSMAATLNRINSQTEPRHSNQSLSDYVTAIATAENITHLVIPHSQGWRPTPVADALAFVNEEVLRLSNQLRELVAQDAA